MVFSDIEVVAGKTSRNVGYVRDNVFRIWTPGAGPKQRGYCRELGGALFLEADEYFDRALMLYLLRARLRSLQASTWADVAIYYSNYFAATSFLRIHLYAVAHLAGGAIFEVEPFNGPTLMFGVSERRRRLAHRDVWHHYYDLVTSMGWPDSRAVSILAPVVEQLRYREQRFRERVNYRAGEGFNEIYLSPTRYLKSMKSTFSTAGSEGRLGSMEDATYNDYLARERLKHVAALLSRLRVSRIDGAIEDSLWNRRRILVERYAVTPTDKRFGLELVDHG